MKRTASKSWAKYTTCTWRTAPKSWLKYSRRINNNNNNNQLYSYYVLLMLPLEYLQYLWILLTILEIHTLHIKAAWKITLVVQSKSLIFYNWSISPKIGLVLFKNTGHLLSQWFAKFAKFSKSKYSNSSKYSNLN